MATQPDSIKKLHLGCGPAILEGFYNYDLSPAAGGISLDLTGNLPHSENSIEFIFSEHFIEHITRAQALHLLQECHRVLKPGGVVRITTPDLKVLVGEYMANRCDKWAAVWKPATPCQMMNYGLTEWGHRFTYDVTELQLLFREAGFTNANQVLHGAYEIRPYMGEITVEGVK